MWMDENNLQIIVTKKLSKKNLQIRENATEESLTVLNRAMYCGQFTFLQHKIILFPASKVSIYYLFYTSHSSLFVLLFVRYSRIPI